MTKNFLPIALLSLLASALLASGPAVAGATGSEGADSTHYGETLSGSATLRIAELLENPEPYLGKTVTVQGLVDDVCPMKGCWIDVLDAQTEQSVRFKVNDGVIEFPVAAKGKSVVAEGVLTKRELTQDQAVSYLSHLAEEKGLPFDEYTVDGPMTLFQLDGLGATVDEAGSP